MTSPSQPPSSPTGRSLVLRLHGEDHVLSEGVSVIGRSPACRITLDDPRVSRRHARIEVRGTSAVLVDLDSANGVLLNGQRLRGAPQPLNEGDVICIGSQTLLVQVRASAPPAAAAGATRSALPPVDTHSEPEPPSHRLRPTRVNAATDLVFQVAGQALDAGNTRDAERVVRKHLAALLEQARASRFLAEAVRVQAVAFALRLAYETRNGAWFDYVVDLLRACRTVCSPENVGKLEHALRRIDAVDAVRLRGYLADLRALPPTLETLRAAQQLEQLLARATREHRLRMRPSRAAPPSSKTGGAAAAPKSTPKAEPPSSR